ncbi:sister chromatid cohesion 1 protein 2-like [Primulina tabacum]|uniref:sister chromatid cohesion 1 protein 2-like n=1 Tax=Primulina tabacum TaxID=48773 RepID=UPI003F5AA6BA
MLADRRINDGSSDGFRCKGKTLCSEAYSTASTPPRDVLSPHDADPDSFGSPFHTMNDSGTNLDLFRGTLFPLEDHLDPMVLDDTEKQQINDPVTTPLHDVIDSITSFEKLHELRSSFRLDEPHDLNVLVNEEHPVDGMNSLEVNNAESKECQRNYPVITVDVTPDSKLPEGGVGTPEVGNVKTPAPKERAKILKKRKMLFDETTVLANKVYKSWISDPSNLICKRRKAPHTILHAWRTRKLSSMSQSILEPLIPRISVNLDSFGTKRKIYKEPVKLVELPSIQDVANSPVMLSSREQIPLAPTAPVIYLTPLISNETEAVAESDILEPKFSLEILENRPDSSGGKELEMLLRDEEVGSSGEDSREKNKYAARTRMTGRYLYKKFLYKKRQQHEEVVDLSEILSQKTKIESARLFYEILVLKMENCIDVRQDSPYGDILLLERPKLKQIYES